MSITINNQMNISNRNFKTLWHALGLEFDWCGSIDNVIVLRALDTFDPEMVLRSDNCGPNWVDYGITREQVNRYVSVLRNICNNSTEIRWS
jgi:hypothetical protein